MSTPDSTLDSASQDGVEDWVLVAGAATIGMAVGAVLTRRVGRALAVGLVAAVGAGVRRRVWEMPPPDDSWARSHAGPGNVAA